MMQTQTTSPLVLWWPGQFDRRHKIVWLAAVVWCTLHLLGFTGAVLFMSDYTRTEVAEWSDLVTYLDAADTLRDRAPLYDLTAWDDVMTYHYHPVFALVFSVFLGLPFRLTSLVWMLIQIAAYLGGLVVWYRVLLALNLPTTAYRVWLPLALVFTEWYANIAYSNIGSMLLLLAGLLTLTLLDEKPGAAGIVAAAILLLKPQWLFPLILPVLFRRWRLLVRVGLALVAIYVAVNGLYLLVVGPDYGLDTLRDYATFLTRLNENYPWQTGGGTFEDMNHSWRQIYLSYLGDRAWVPAVSELTKVVMLIVPGLLILRAWQRKVTAVDSPWLALWFVGLGYVVAMAMLAQLWDAFGGIVFFLFIQAAPERAIRRWSWLFLVYAVYELPGALSMVTGWDWLLLPQSVPLTMLALLVLYMVLVMLAARSLAEIPVPE
jgi:hypothetical protein